MSNWAQNIVKQFRVWGTAIAGATWGSINWLLAGTKVDYRREAGRIYDNSAVLSSINWLWRNMLSARLVVQRPVIATGKTTTWEEVPGHPLIEAIENGPYYDHTVLFYGAALSWIVFGNGYWLKIRSELGLVIGYFYVPHDQIEPRADIDNPDGTKLITYYRYTPLGGVPTPILPDDVVHFRHGVDPQNPMLGMSPLMAALREVVGDNTAATIGTAILLNGGVTGLAISPKEGTTKSMPPDKLEAFKEKWLRRSTGDGAGTPHLLPFPVEVTHLGYSPDKLALDKTRSIAVARILSSYGIDPIVLGLDRDHMTLDNFGKAVEASTEGALLPMLKLWAIQLTHSTLRKDFTNEKGLRVGWDTSEMAALQEDEDKLYTRTVSAYKEGVIKRKDARQKLGFEVDETKDDVYRTDMGQTDPLLGNPQDKPGQKSASEMIARAREARAKAENAAGA